MKTLRSLLALLFIGIVGAATAQTILVTTTAGPKTIYIGGNVQTKQGDMLHLAFLLDKQSKSGAYTDSLGNFVMLVRLNSMLKVSCRGFKDTLIAIGKQTSFSIVLNNIDKRSNIPTPVDENANINIATLRDELILNEPGNPGEIKGTVIVPGPTGAKAYIVTSPGVDAAQGAIYPVFHHKDETQGSRFVFSEWVHGFVVNNRDSLVQSPVLFFNYDKIGGTLLLSKDKHTAIEIYRDKVKSFTLFNVNNQPSTFTIVPEIDKSHFVQVICSGNNYKIYKSIKTKFLTADYHSDGLASTGNNFDSYEDENTYYVLDVKAKQLQKMTLKKKAIKQFFAAYADKLTKFMADNSSDINDNYLGNLCNYIN